MTDRIEEFYDDFLDRRMVEYRLEGNRRLDRANRFVRQQIDPHSRVLDVGCGIGISTEVAASRAREGKVWAFDLSSRNVDYARRTVRRDNVEWATLDVLSAPERLRQFVTEQVDVIIMIDVLEHIPLPAQPALFDTLLSVAVPGDVRFVITFPSTAYQEYLRTTDPGELQPVDEDITAEHLDVLARSRGLQLALWKSVDVWMTDQYVHACLRTAKAPERLPDTRSVVRRRADGIRRRLARRLRERRYAIKGSRDL